MAVFDNRFPAFEAPSGAAEVVVYTDDHDASFGTLAAERAEALMWVWRHRYEEFGAREDIEYVFIFENRGVEVGVTLRHPHGQIYGYPFLPPVPALEVAADVRLGGCAPCSLISRELADRERVVHESESLVAYVPFAARWPYEVHVVMREHRPSLLETAMRTAARPRPRSAVAHARIRRALRQAVSIRHGRAPGADGPGPRGAEGHLHVEFYPPLRSAEKLKYMAGSEQGAGTFISDILPEATAAELRKAIARAA